MIHRIYFILLLLSLSFTAKAQLGKELILNGGFEEYAKVTPPPSGEDDEEDEEEEPPGYFDPYQKPLYWYFNSSLFYTRTKDAHSGVFAVKVYPNGGSFFSRDENFNPYHIAIEAGGEYRLTYWYKGNVKNPNITVTVDWYKGTTSKNKETRDNEKATDFSDQWQQKTFTFKAPAGVDKAGVGLYIENDYMSAESGGCILIDDISFVQTKEGKPSAALEAPSNVVVRPHPQHVRHKKAYMEQLKARYAGRDDIEIQTDFSSNSTVFDSDLLITDWSDISWEFAFTTKKPVLFINTPMKVMNPDWQKTAEVPLNIALRDVIGRSLEVDEIDKAGDTVLEMLGQQEQYREQIDRAMHEYVYNIGSSTRIGAKYIIGAIQKKAQERKENK